jgi:uncharacterized protein
MNEKLIFGVGLAVLILAGCSPAKEQAVEVNLKPPTAVTAPTESGGKNLSRIFQLKDLQQVTIKTKNATIAVWVMDTEDKQREGMMFLENREVKDSQGMIFPYKEPQLASSGRGFWMHNTPLALDIVYVGANKKVINIGAGKPYNEDVVVPRGDYLYVIEVKAGLAMKLGLTPGSVVDIPKEVVPKV